jgi:hypothetical protein
VGNGLKDVWGIVGKIMWGKFWGKYMSISLGGGENFEATQHSSLWYQKVKVPRGSISSIYSLSL